jgi:hypothetical protein
LNTIFNARDIFEMIIKVYDSDPNIYCCEEHLKMLCEKNTDCQYLSNPFLLAKVNSLLSVIEKIFTSGKIIAVDQLKLIIPLLSVNISPCLQKSILVIINNIINPIGHGEYGQLDEVTRNKYITVLLKNKGLEHILYISSISTLDVRIECLKLFDLFTKLHQNVPINMDDFIPFIVNTIFPLRTPLGDSSGNMNRSSIKEMTTIPDYFDGTDIQHHNRHAMQNTIHDDLKLTTIDKVSEKHHSNSDLINLLDSKNRKVALDEKNSLIVLEDECWRFIIHGSLTKNLNIPDIYIKNYSNELNDHYLEKLYDYLLKWMINKYDNNIDLDDADTIGFEAAVNIIMKVIMYSNVINKQKCLLDLYLLTKQNKTNCVILMSNKYFYQWLLDLILPYQVLLLNDEFKGSSPSGVSETVKELGIKIHTSVMANSINSDDKKKIDHSLKFQFLLTWMYKIRLIGSLESKAATSLVRALLTNLVTYYSEQLKLMSANYKYPTWLSYLNLTLIIYEFVVFANFDRKIIEKQISFDQLEKAEILIEVIQHLNIDYECKTPYREINNISVIDIWSDRELLIGVYDNYKNIWHEGIFKTDKKSSTMSDETKFVENLINRLIFDSKPNFFIEDLKLLLFSSSNDNISFESARSHNIMRAILNIIIIIIRLSESKDDVFYWVKELEKFTLFVISAVENAKVDSNISEAFLTYAQEASCQTIILVFNFLIDEIKSPRRIEFSDELVDYFKSTLRFLFIYMCIVLEKLNSMIEANLSKNNNVLVSSLIQLKNAFLIKNSQFQLFSPCWKIYTEYLMNPQKTRLFEIEDIKEFRLNKFIEIPERFNTDSWIYAFQENHNIYKVIQDQFNFNYFEKLIHSRIFEASNIVLNNDISSKEKAFVNSVSKIISNNIKESLGVVDNMFKKQIYDMIFKNKVIESQWNGLVKKLFLPKGKWHHEGILVKYKVGNHLSKSLSKPLLFPILNIERYLPKFNKFNIPEFFQDHKLEVINKEVRVFNRDSTKSTMDTGESKDKLNLSELRTKMITNKASLFYNRAEFSDFIDKYTDLEKLTKYFYKYNSEDYNKIILNISEFYINTTCRSNFQTIKFEACRVKLGKHIKGKIIINPLSVQFIRNIPKQSDNKCIESLFCEYEKSNEKVIIEVAFKDLRYVYKRRYYYKKTALEIFTYTNKHYYFNFKTQTDRDSFCKLLYEFAIANDNKNLFDYNIDTKRFNALIGKLVEDWANWKLSNFDFLLQMNIMAGRSFLDLTQYPVFPWVIKDYKTENLVLSLVNYNNQSYYIRDLSKPIGTVGSEDRIELYKTTYNESVNDSDMTDATDGNYFYSSHYSNPFYVTNFLTRIFPYTYAAIELQGGGHFDRPERLFLSIPGAFNNSMTQTTDLRELIPEFYYLPEVFRNINHVNFGTIDGNYVNDVVLPIWARDEFNYIVTNRTFLESEFVSYKLNEWIDLIFGYKQKGKEAVNAMNLYCKYTYEDEIDIDNIQNTNPDNYSAYIAKVDFGQTPSQILKNALIQRVNRGITKMNKMFIDNMKNMKVFKSVSEMKNQYKSRKDIVHKMMIKITSLNNDRLICIYNNGIVQLLKFIDTPFSLSKFTFIMEKECILTEKLTLHQKRELQPKEIVDEDDNIMREINLNQPVKVIMDGKYIIKGGYWDGKFLVFNTTTQESVYYATDDDSKVLCVEVIESLLLVGTASGRLYAYEINMEDDSVYLLSNSTVLCDHDAPINYISTCNRLNVIATTSNDKTCNLYTYPLLKLFRVIKSDITFDYCFISASPLPSLILYSSRAMIYHTYSINGKLIHTQQDGVKYLFSPVIISDCAQQDYIVIIPF